MMQCGKINMAYNAANAISYYSMLSLGKVETIETGLPYPLRVIMLIKLKSNRPNAVTYRVRR